MPIVIAREGLMEPVTTGIPPERRQAAWARIAKAWAEKHPELLRPEGAPAPHTPAGKTDKEA